MSSDKILKTFVKYVSLNIAGMAGQSVYIIIDTFFISFALGVNGLVALNISIPVIGIMWGLSMMIGLGGAILFAIYRSREEHAATDAVFMNSIMLELAFGVLLIVLGLFFSREIAELLGAEGIIIEMAGIYIKSILCFGPMLTLERALLFFVCNDGNPSLASASMLTYSAANIILDYIFIFIFHMGMFGAGLAFGLSGTAALFVLTLHFISRKNSLRFVKIKPELNQIKKILGLGTPNFVTGTSSSFVMIALNLIILSITGNRGVAAYGIIANLAFAVNTFFTGLSQGMQPVASNSFGIGNIPAVRKVLRYAMVTAITISSVSYIIIVLFKIPLIAIFNNKNDLLLAALAENGALLYFTGFFFAGINIIASTFLCAVEKPKGAFAISLLRGCIFIIPLAFILSKMFDMNGVWLSFLASEMLTFAVSLILLRKERFALSENPIHDTGCGCGRL